jgi:ribosomal protein S27E
MAQINCPYCGASVKLDVSDQRPFFGDVSPEVTCDHCGEAFELPENVRKKLQAGKDYDDLATLDFLADDEIDGLF